MKYGLKIAALAAIASATGIANTAVAFEPGEWLVRVGAMNVAPKNNNHEIVSVDDAVSATIGFTYMMTDVWAIDLLGAYPFEHDIDLVGGGKVASTEHLPPTLSLQWRPLPNGKMQPYLGLGINYTSFFDEKTEGALAGTSLDLDSSWGVAAQAGFDVVIGEKAFLNFDLRWIDIDTDAKLDGVSIGKVEISPLVYGAHLGFRF
jgi:outer membrane protein